MVVFGMYYSVFLWGDLDYKNTCHSERNKESLFLKALCKHF